MHCMKTAFGYIEFSRATMDRISASVVGVPSVR
jgi:hypothetical protein